MSEGRLSRIVSEVFSTRRNLRTADRDVLEEASDVELEESLNGFTRNPCGR